MDFMRKLLCFCPWLQYLLHNQTFITFKSLIVLLKSPFLRTPIDSICANHSLGNCPRVSLIPVGSYFNLPCIDQQRTLLKTYSKLNRTGAWEKSIQKTDTQSLVSMLAESLGEI